jgi:hypothetical protein
LNLFKIPFDDENLKQSHAIALAGRPLWLALMWRNPGFSLAAIVTLALGIGANSAIFSAVNALTLKPLPYHDPRA